MPDCRADAPVLGRAERPSLSMGYKLMGRAPRRKWPYRGIPFRPFRWQEGRQHSHAGPGRSPPAAYGSKPPAAANSAGHAPPARRRGREESAPRTANANAADCAGQAVGAGSPSWPMNCFRECPDEHGQPRACSSAAWRSNSRLCSAVFPNPIPGSARDNPAQCPGSWGVAAGGETRFTSATTSP